MGLVPIFLLRTWKKDIKSLQGEHNVLCMTVASRGGWSSVLMLDDACVLECHAVKMNGMEDEASMIVIDRFTNTQRHSLILIKGLSVMYEHCLIKRGMFDRIESWVFTSYGDNKGLEKAVPQSIDRRGQAIWIHL